MNVIGITEKASNSWLRYRHHGEQNLMPTIINLAQTFVGSNNINLLIPSGQFGTRLQGGKDSAFARYLSTKLSPLARRLFPVLDDPLLNNLFDDNLKIEPKYYVPIIPLVLVNGTHGVGSGWKTDITNYNPREIVANIHRLLNGEPIVPLKPWFKGFRGSVVQVDTQKFLTIGEIGILDDNTIEITELPIGSWTQTYKDSVLEPLLRGTPKTPSFISGYREFHTESTVRFVVTLPKANLRKARTDGIHQKFKLVSWLSTTNMVLFDEKGYLKRYDTIDDILKEWYPIRLELYRKRKLYYEGLLAAELLQLKNMKRFIAEKNEHKLETKNRVTRADFERQLIERKYDSDPVKAWMANNSAGNGQTHDMTASNENHSISATKNDFNYLLDMRSMFWEEFEELCKQIDNKKNQLKQLMGKSPKDLWVDELQAFLEALNHLEQEEERLDKLVPIIAEAKPSPLAQRVEPYLTKTTEE